MIKTPSFWYQNSWVGKVLQPLSYFYLMGHHLHQSSSDPYRSPLPVICIGNVVVGGSGKTPATLALIDIIQAHYQDKKIAVLTRGYGGEKKGPFIVDLNQDCARTAGDEALLLAQKTMVIVSANRAAGAKLAEENGADIIVMDDGMQNPHLHKTLTFLTIDGKTGFGNGQLLPSGPMRQPLTAALNQSHAILVIGESDNLDLPEDKPIITAHIEPVQRPDPAKSYYGFAGLGRPEKFKNTLRNMGLTLTGWKSFADHHNYTRRDMEQLIQEANKQEAQLITTEKDFVRIPTAFQDFVEPLPIELIFDDPFALLNILKETIEKE